MNSETNDEKSSGEEAPAAINVAPATSSDILNSVAKTFNAGTKLETNEHDVNETTKLFHYLGTSTYRSSVTTA